jgi:hypothetical protein
MHRRNVHYGVGDVVDFDKARVDDLVARGFVEMKNASKSAKKAGNRDTADDEQ